MCDAYRREKSELPRSLRSFYMNCSNSGKWWVSFQQLRADLSLTCRVRWNGKPIHTYNSYLTVFTMLLLYESYLIISLINSIIKCILPYVNLIKLYLISTIISRNQCSDCLQNLRIGEVLSINTIFLNISNKLLSQVPWNTLPMLTWKYM